jgi:hypothetical protein
LGRLLHSITRSDEVRLGEWWERRPQRDAKFLSGAQLEALGRGGTCGVEKFFSSCISRTASGVTGKYLVLEAELCWSWEK